MCVIRRPPPFLEDRIVRRESGGVRPSFICGRERAVNSPGRDGVRNFLPSLVSPKKRFFLNYNHKN